MMPHTAVRDGNLGRVCQQQHTIGCCTGLQHPIRAYTSSSTCQAANLPKVLTMPCPVPVPPTKQTSCAAGCPGPGRPAGSLQCSMCWRADHAAVLGRPPVRAAAAAAVGLGSRLVGGQGGACGQEGPGHGCWAAAVRLQVGLGTVCGRWLGVSGGNQV